MHERAHLTGFGLDGRVERVAIQSPGGVRAAQAATGTRQRGKSTSTLHKTSSARSSGWHRDVARACGRRARTGAPGGRACQALCRASRRACCPQKSCARKGVGAEAVEADARIRARPLENMSSSRSLSAHATPAAGDDEYARALSERHARAHEAHRLVETSQLGRDASAQRVVIDVDELEEREHAQLRRQRARETVPHKIYGSERGCRPELGRNGAVEVLRGEGAARRRRAACASKAARGNARVTLRRCRARAMMPVEAIRPTLFVRGARA
jgi:hypothetical protein